MYMAAVTIDRIGVPSGLHDRRVLAWTRARADDALAGRTVWCAAALPAGRLAAERLRTLLEGDCVVRPLAVAENEAPATGPLDAAPSLAYAQGAEHGEALIDGRVEPGDVVVLHDALTVPLAGPARERGAHVICDLPPPRLSKAPGVATAQALLEPYAAVVDAFVLSWEERRAAVERIAALLPAAGLVDVKDVTIGGGRPAAARRMALAWSSVLGGVLEVDRSDRVGGTLHVRPAVASR
jgi:hypothetical protein